MHGANARAGQHGIGRFRDHRQVERDAVALLDAVLLHHVGELADLFVQFAIGDLLVVVGVVAFPDDGNLVGALLQVAVDAIVGDVENTVFKPLDRHIVRTKTGVLDLLGRLEPVEALGLLAPELGRVLHRLGIHLLVTSFVNQGALFPSGRYRIDFLGHGVFLP